MKHFIYLIVLAFYSLPCKVTSAQPYEYSSHSNLVDFGILYPIPQLENGLGVKRRQQGAAGFRFHYQFFLSKRLGATVTPSAWFVPLRVDGNRATLYSLNFESGGVFRPIPGTYFDPSLQVSGGAALMNAGDKFGRNWAYPVSSELGVNLYRNVSRFKDTELAFQVYGGTKYYFNVNKAMDPLFFHFGIAFRGSF